MTPEHELKAARKAFAEQIMPFALPRNERVEKALATVRREAFFGEGRWILLLQERATERSEAPSAPRPRAAIRMLGPHAQVVACILKERCEWSTRRTL
jgi:protein-L-isoaspartate O-methyltransferase